MASKPRALVLGHSFVRRVRGVVEVIDLHQANDNYRRDLAIWSLRCEIFGVGGRSVDKMIRLDLEVIKRNALMSWFWRSRSNDICDSHCDADTVALFIVAFTELLLNSLSVPFVVVAKYSQGCIPHLRTTNERVEKVNTLLRALRALQNIHSAKFWRHWCLANSATNVYARDGIHLNDYLFALTQFQ